jgi:endonuclease YncB( thermonuclease family)
MVDVVFVPRSRWRRAHWRIAGGRRGARPQIFQPVRTAKRLLSRLARIWGLIALAGLATGAVLLSLGYVQDIKSPRVTQRFAAVAIDGDSLRAGGWNIRILGIDAPELFQTCRDEHGGSWACGREAHARLSALASFGALECSSASKDVYGRTLATCSTGSVPDIGEAMVREGYAVSFMSARYWLAELDARWNRRGLWRGTFDRPQAWRRGARGAG